MDFFVTKENLILKKVSFREGILVLLWLVRLFLCHTGKSERSLNCEDWEPKWLSYRSLPAR